MGKPTSINVPGPFIFLNKKNKAEKKTKILPFFTTVELRE
jgi:hypothetical protein